MAGGFKQFLLRGNVVDLAVGVVVGAAFGGGGDRVYERSADAADRGYRRKAGFFRNSVHRQRQQVSDRRFYQRRSFRS